MRKSSMTPSTLIVLADIEQCVIRHPGMTSPEIEKKLNLTKFRACKFLNRLACMGRLKKSKKFDQDYNAIVCGWVAIGCAQALPTTFASVETPCVIWHAAIQIGMPRMDIVAALFGDAPARSAEHA